MKELTRCEAYARQGGPGIYRSLVRDREPLELDV